MDLSYLYNIYNLENARTSYSSTGLIYYDIFNNIYHNVSTIKDHEIYNFKNNLLEFISLQSIDKKLYNKAIKNIDNIIDGKSRLGSFYHTFYIDNVFHYRIILESCQILLDKNKMILDILSPINHTSFRKYKSIKKNNKSLSKKY
jgi:hypothetical protein